MWLVIFTYYHVNSSSERVEKHNSIDGLLFAIMASQAANKIRIYRIADK